MPESQSRRYTIGQLMAFIAAFALVLALPRLPAPVGLETAAGVVLLLLAFALINASVESMFGIQCPRCSRFTLNRLARHRAYFRCSACWARVKRYGFGPWLDASGPEVARIYHRNPEALKWKGYEVPEDLDGTTTSSLLRNKRHRNQADGE